MSASGTYDFWSQAPAEQSRACNDYGIALARDGRFEEAAAWFRYALQLQPDNETARGNLARACNQEGVSHAMADRFQEATVWFREASACWPDWADPHSNLGNALASQGKLDEAVASHEAAIRLTPDNPNYYNNLARDLYLQGRHPEAIATFQRAIDLKPDYAEAHENLGMVWLLLGNFEKGLPEYEWRAKRQRPDLPPEPFPGPLWDGSPLAGRTLLLHAEQGWGDTLQFIRYAALVKQQGGTVFFAGHDALMPLIGRCPGIDRLFWSGEPIPSVDAFAVLLSLPYLLGTTLATIPANVPYLFADPARVEHWRPHFDGLSGLRVGIFWHGRVMHPGDPHQQRSVPLQTFLRLGKIPNVQLISLQVHPGAEHLSAVPDLSVIDVGSRFQSFEDTAAVIKQVDLVITVDTALAHLAGGMGVPVWVVLPIAADWRWLLDREDNPWYPTMRLFRQKVPGDWDEVFTRVADELRKKRKKVSGPYSGPAAG